MKLTVSLSFTRFACVIFTVVQQFALILKKCPKIREILSYILEDRFGFRVLKVEWTSSMPYWREEECRRVGTSMATFLRKRKTGEAALGE